MGKNVFLALTEGQPFSCPVTREVKQSLCILVLWESGK
jgi:hypothetical protein